MKNTKLDENAFKTLIDMRRWMHAHPELSGQEKETSAYLRRFAEGLKPDDIIPLAKHGLAVVFCGEKPGPSILIRGDIDALPIQEINDNLPHKSVIDGVSHKCGHDGHAAIVAGLGMIYAAKRPARGRVILLFQPAEETAQGARAVIEDPAFAQIRPDYAFALHNIPGKKMHTILCKPGSFTCAVKSMILTFTGKTAHASKPETGLNPSLAIANLIHAVQDINKTMPQGTFATLIHTLIGEKAYGVSAGYGELHLTLRGRSNEDMNLLWSTLEQAARKEAQDHGLTITFDAVEEFMANTNDPFAYQTVKNMADTLGLDFEEMDAPNPWGEDFGWITSNLKGAMFGLGAGTGPDLHNPDYDFPDELIATGIAAFDEIIDQIISEA